MERKNTKRAGIISRIRKFIDSNIAEEYILILAYMTIVGLSIVWWVYTTK
jgi:hypothetical protein